MHGHKSLQDSSYNLEHDPNFTHLYKIHVDGRWETNNQRIGAL